MIVKESEIRKLIIKKLLKEALPATDTGETDYDELFNQAAQGVAALGVVSAAGPAGYGALKGAVGGIRLPDNEIVSLYQSNFSKLPTATQDAAMEAYEAALNNLNPEGGLTRAAATPAQKIQALEKVAQTIPEIRPSSYNVPRPSGTSDAIRYGLKSAGKGAKSALRAAVTKFGSLGKRTTLGAVTVATIAAAAYWANNNKPIKSEDKYVALLNGEACEAMKTAFIQLAGYYESQGNNDYANQIKKQPVYVDDANAQTAAEQFYEATISWGTTVPQIGTGRLPFGAGTDEELIKTTIENLPTVLDFCKVAKKFKENHGVDLGTVLRGELSNDDFKTYVLDPIEVLAKDKFVNFLGTTYGYTPWQDLMKDGHLMIEQIVEAENQDAAAADYVSSRENDYFIDDGYSQVSPSRSGSVSDGRIVTMSPTDPWEYMVNTVTGCWVTRKKRSRTGKWISLGGQKWKRATRILDNEFNLRTQAQKDKCSGSSSGGSGSSTTSLDTGIDNSEESLSVASVSSSRNRRLGPKDLQVSINMYNDPKVKTLNEFCNDYAAEKDFKEMIVDRMREHFRSGGRANVFKRDETINIAVDFDRKGKKVKSVKRVKGSESFQLLRFSGIRDGIKRFFAQYPPAADVSGPSRGRSKRGQPDLEIIITFKSGVYSPINEVAQLKNIIRKLLK